MITREDVKRAIGPENYTKLVVAIALGEALGLKLSCEQDVRNLLFGVISEMTEDRFKIIWDGFQQYVLSGEKMPSDGGRRGVTH